MDGSLSFDELGCAVWRIRGDDLQSLRKRTTEEVLRELEPQASSPAGPDPYLQEARRLGRTGQKKPAN